MYLMQNRYPLLKILSCLSKVESCCAVVEADQARLSLLN
jgi:hypothetical protein